jgi:hypothetical protein
MDGLIKQLSERLAAQPSRRGFVSTLGKVALGAAVALKGSGMTDSAEAASSNMKCCTGTPCSTTAPNIGPCPNGWNVSYAWVCAGGRFPHMTWDCLDCYDSNHNYRCTYFALRTL